MFHLSIEVSFPLKNKQINWSPKTPKYDPMTNKYYLNFHGHSGHIPIKSSRNIVLANILVHTTFIVRKIGYYVYEKECLPVVDPLIAFTIGLSDIMGPYLDPLGNIVI